MISNHNMDEDHNYIRGGEYEGQNQGNNAISHHSRISHHSDNQGYNGMTDKKYGYDKSFIIQQKIEWERELNQGVVDLYQHNNKNNNNNNNKNQNK